MRLFKYISAVVIISFVLAAASTVIINKGLKRSSIDFYGKINAVNSPQMAINILLAGSSRTLTNINPEIIDSVTQLKSYNAGLNAAKIKTCYNIIATAIQNQPQLKAVVLNVDFNMFHPEIDPYKDPYYYAYTSENKHIILTDNSKANKIHGFKIFDITAYDDYVIYAALRGLAGNADFSKSNGFIPHVEQGFTIDTTVMPTGYQPYTKTGEDIFKNLIALCKEKNICLMMVIAPYVKQLGPWLYINNYAQIIEKVKNIATQNQVPFFDYSLSDIGNDTSYFYNSWHLTLRGANTYSRYLADSIRQYMCK